MSDESMHFSPDSTWLPIEERMARETNPRRLALLTEVRNHMRAEISGEFEALMDTLTADPQYHLWGLPVEVGPKGYEAVETFYKNMFAGGGNRFHFIVDRIVVDDDAVVTEGRMRQPMPGGAVAAQGVDQVEGEPVDPDATYLAEWQLLTVWPADAAGKLIGEDIYFGSPPMASLKRA